MLSLSESDRGALLRLAREAVLAAVSRGCLLEIIPEDGVFAERSGIFITLHVSGRLRGCIGVVEANEPLGDTVVRCAASAALYDPRFSPMRQDELGELQIQISLLSSLVTMQPHEIEIGRHGLLVARGSHRGVLLPQVATEHGLTREQFLEETCRKAELSRDAWSDSETQLSGFTCEVFCENGLVRNC